MIEIQIASIDKKHKNSISIKVMRLIKGLKQYISLVVLNPVIIYHKKVDYKSQKCRRSSKIGLDGVN
jgi:hypothetical protein